jgi:transcriptional regulator with XRE-family HTH domain
MSKYKSFGKIIRELRRDHRWSVYVLAQRAGLSDQGIHDLENEKRQPTLETARRLAEALGTTLIEIVGQMPPLDLPEPVPGRPRGRPRKSVAVPATGGVDKEPLAPGERKVARRGRKAKK